MLTTFILRVAYLRFFIKALFFIFYEKTGNFLTFFQTLFSTIHNKKSMA